MAQCKSGSRAEIFFHPSRELVLAVEKRYFLNLFCNIDFLSVGQILKGRKSVWFLGIDLVVCVDVSCVRCTTVRHTDIIL